MNATMRKENAITEILGNLDDSILVQVWNNYCCENGNTEDYINSNDEFEINDRLSMMKPFDILTGIDKYNANDDYFVEGIYGIRSFNDILEVVCIGDLAKAILREESILTDATEESDWADTLIEHFEILLNEAGLSHDVNWEDELDTDDLLTRDWADLIDELDTDK